MYFQEQKPPQPWTNVRLTDKVKPTSYQLYLHPDLNKGTFSGKVTIAIELTAPQSYISVHSKGLNITTSKILVGKRTIVSVPLSHCFEYSENEFWIVETENELKPNSYNLYFEFNGSLKNKIVGFYQSTYVDSDGEHRYVLKMT